MSSNEEQLARLAYILVIIEYKKVFESLSRSSLSREQAVNILIEKVDVLANAKDLDRKEFLKHLKQLAALTLRTMVEFGLKR